jgi:hypothetical protein
MNKVISVNKFSYFFRWHPAEINYSVIPIVFLLLFFVTAFPVHMFRTFALYYSPVLIIIFINHDTFKENSNECTLLVKVAWTRLAPVLT